MEPHHFKESEELEVYTHYFFQTGMFESFLIKWVLFDTINKISSLLSKCYILVEEYKWTELV